MPIGILFKRRCVVRLDLYGAAATDSTQQLSSTELAHAAAAKDATKAKPSAIEDKTTLSSGTDSVKTLTKSALEVAPTRAAKVAALKQAVSTAQYQLDSAKIADALSASEF